jgi:putative ABC transport system permease protein
MPETKLLRARGIEGISWAVPLYKGNVRVRTADGNFQNAIMIGLDDSTLIGGPNNMVTGKVSDLRQADAVIVDVNGAKRLLQGDIDRTDRSVGIGDTLEINDRRAVVVGLTNATRTFGSQPVIYTTYSRAMRFSPGERLKLTFILAGLKDGANVKNVMRDLVDTTGLKAMTAKEFKDITLNYVLKNTGMPINFGVSVAMGFLIGSLIAGMLFFNFLQDNIRQFGALKAMGASNGTLTRMIVIQALFAGMTGWGIGVGLAAAFGYSIQNSIMAFKMSWHILVLSGVSVLLIVTVAALISIRKVIKLEPAIVFK